MNSDGYIKNHFYAIHVTDTVALTLKQTIYNVLANNDFNVQDIIGRGYDEVSNM